MSDQEPTPDVLHIYTRADADLARECGFDIRAICGTWIPASRPVDDSWMDCPACVLAAEGQRVHSLEEGVR